MDEHSLVNQTEKAVIRKTIVASRKHNQLRWMRKGANLTFHEKDDFVFTINVILTPFG